MNDKELYVVYWRCQCTSKGDIMYNYQKLPATKTEVTFGKKETAIGPFTIESYLKLIEEIKNTVKSWYSFYGFETSENFMFIELIKWKLLEKGRRETAIISSDPIFDFDDVKPKQ